MSCGAVSGFAEGAVELSMSALPPKADIRSATRDVRFGPKADIRRAPIVERPLWLDTGFVSSIYSPA